ncbi:Rhodanese-related sulfurtransferase [endosymbiont of Ridgeia piscesae]|uniref:Rhodanese-related sulfurtransferase n=2 Tax=endosymbiont of Ridgeia piscesae TaxID=54398 RepID=A0A0T5YTN8_9GAMM|nr:Rhodanese-related sulfurtransferase [endosymbiont of Ridgeia piscesae]KRT58616.1 Rhodanese-related sulfurtransferase [endosymbiont of Ridgeia piscesae]
MAAQWRLRPNGPVRFVVAKEPLNESWSRILGPESQSASPRSIQKLPNESEKNLMKKFLQLISDCLTDVGEIMPWDLEERLQANPELLVVDVREPYEYDAMHIEGSLCVPRGILESACEWDYEETIPELVRARQREVVVVCRSGYRSVLAAFSLMVLGYENVVSLKTGLRGWNDYEQPLLDVAGEPVDIEAADDYFTSRVREDQLSPK